MILIFFRLSQIRRKFYNSNISLKLALKIELLSEQKIQATLLHPSEQYSLQAPSVPVLDAITKIFFVTKKVTFDAHTHTQTYLRIEYVQALAFMLTFTLSRVSRPFLHRHSWREMSRYNLAQARAFLTERAAAAAAVDWTY